MIIEVLPIMASTVLEFWFEELQPQQWWAKDPELDRLIAKRFKSIHAVAAKAELYEWRDIPAGRLAEIIVLDQLSRNIYRDTPLAFASDPLALALAQEALRCHTHLVLPPQQRVFLYMPFMHSESPAMHRIAVELYREPGLELNLDFELRHKAIIDRFGRYPHRNVILGRISTDEEQVFLQQQDTSF